MPRLLSPIEGAPASSCAGKIDEIYGEAREDGADRDEKVREGETDPLTGGTHLSGRTKILGRNSPCFNIR
jgi:hypothetical protein